MSSIRHLPPATAPRRPPFKRILGQQPEGPWQNGARAASAPKSVGRAEPGAWATHGCRRAAGRGEAPASLASSRRWEGSRPGRLGCPPPRPLSPSRSPSPAQGTHPPGGRLTLPPCPPRPSQALMYSTQPRVLSLHPLPRVLPSRPAITTHTELPGAGPSLPCPWTSSLLTPRTRKTQRTIIDAKRRILVSMEGAAGAGRDPSPQNWPFRAS